MAAGKILQYPTVLFDWGDTVMRDDPSNTMPMVDWKSIEIIEGITEVLSYLQSSGRQIILATSAAISDEGQIRGALERGNLNQYFSKIYCFKNTGLSKGDVFYRYVLDDLQVPASDVLMAGDHFEKDVLIPNALGMYAIWFNPRSNEDRRDSLHITVHSMNALLDFFKTVIP